MQTELSFTFKVR